MAYSREAVVTHSRENVETGEDRDRFLDHLSDFVGEFDSIFRRKDQARWLRVYLQGLLQGSDRRTAEGLGRSLAGLIEGKIGDLAQALQNFVNQSPWDENLIWQQYRRQLADRLDRQPVFWVVEDQGFAKQGRHSVGVHRQYWAGFQGKTNCQLAVTISAIGPLMAYPLGTRLYLPRQWTADPARLRTAGVPEHFHQPRTKGQIALELIQEMLAAGHRPNALIAGSTYGSGFDLHQGLAEQNIPYLLEVPEDYLLDIPVPTAVRELAQRLLLPNQASGWFPLSHGGNPEAWATGLFVKVEPSGQRAFAVGRLPGNWPSESVENLWHARQRQTALFSLLREELGLGHFEGRSWRGFHHHFCLVALAHGFCLLYGTAQ